MQLTPLRKALLNWVEQQGKSIHGSILHAGSGSDAHHYSRFFPYATRYRNLDHKKHVNVDVVADVQNMPEIPSQSEDCVLAVFVLHQVDDVKASMLEFKRVLRPKGVFLGEFTAPGWSNVLEGNHRWTKEGALKVAGAHFKIQTFHNHYEGERLISTFIRGIK